MATVRLEQFDASNINPIDTSEELAAANDWPYERDNRDELTIFIPGRYTDFQFRVLWREDYQTIQFACLFDLKLAEKNREEIYKAIGLANERMWIGHFEYWAEEEVLLFRHASLAPDPMMNVVSDEHISTLIDTAMSECDRFYPVFQFVIWGGQTASQAVESAMLDVVGTA